MTSTINFGSVYELKQFMIDELAPKYFDLNDVNQYNVGLLGYTTEAMTVFTEESFNAANTMFKEVFITRATFPETIYAEAGILGIDDISAKPASVRAVLFVKKDDVIEKGRVSNNVIQFVIDRDTIIDVDGIEYSLDYDIHVISRPDRKGDYIITAQYDMSEENSISPLSHPFIRTHRSIVTGIEYVALFLTVQQYKRTEHTESLITSNTINFPSIEVEYEDMFVGMDVFYKNPDSNKYEKLILRVQGAPPLKKPFIYYEHIDTNSIRLSFTTRDNYFKPQYNSDLRVVIYSTTGAAGNYKVYNGSNINVVNSTSERVDYYGNPILWASVLGSSIGGRDIQSLEDLRTAVVEKKATSGAHNTESDLELYFNNRVEGVDGAFLKFIKRRDDLVERLFSCFGLFKETDGNYYQTNTLHMQLTEEDFDKSYDNGNRLTIKPGRMICYVPDSITTGQLVEKKCIQNGDTSDDTFTYSNPFLISMQKQPNSISYYNNSIDKIVPLDYKYNDMNSEYQFIINNVSVKRNAIAGEDGYKFSVNLIPNFTLTLNDDGEPIFDKDIKVVLSFQEGSNETRASIMTMVDFNPETSMLTFETELLTDDEISKRSSVIINNIYDVQTGLFGEKSIPMMDATINISILTSDDSFGSKYNPFTEITPLKNYTLVAKYTTETEPVTLIKPMNHIRSRVRFDPYIKEVDEEGNEIMDYIATVDLVPLVSYDLISSNDRLMYFLQEVNYIYDYIDRIMQVKTTNYSIDVKFYNTYGKSRNFVVNEDKHRLDRVNLSFRVQVAFEFGTILENAIHDLKEKIKKYVEDINTKIDSNVDLRGYNGIYVSNLIQQIENEYSLVRYMKFKQINHYDSSVQVVENETVDMNLLPHVQRREYVPEFLTIHLDDIAVDIL